MPKEGGKLKKRGKRPGENRRSFQAQKKNAKRYRNLFSRMGIRLDSYGLPGQTKNHSRRDKRPRDGTKDTGG